MPYFRCPRCALRVYSAAAWSTVDTCPGCAASLRRVGRSLGTEAPSVRRHVEAGRDAPRAVRDSLASFRGVLGPDVHETLRLLASELVANSVTHGPGGAVLVDAAISDGHVRVEVTDEGNGFDARPRPLDPARLDGRGLLIVDTMSDRWGVGAPDSSSVWFELDRPPALDAAAGF